MKILLECLKPGCPRKKKIEKTSDMPKRAVVMKSYCPWHDGRCDKAYPEIFFDSKGKEVSDYDC